MLASVSMSSSSSTLENDGLQTLFFNAVASTRKVQLALPIALSDLRLAFAREMQVDIANLPPLYIRDRQTNIEYELVRTLLLLFRFFFFPFLSFLTPSSSNQVTMSIQWLFSPFVRVNNTILLPPGPRPSPLRQPRHPKRPAICLNPCCCVVKSLFSSLLESEFSAWSCRRLLSCRAFLQSLTND